MPKAHDKINRIFANFGKALSSYQRSLRLAPSRFDNYAEQLLRGREFAERNLLSEEEVLGLRLFIGKGRCVQCHTGPHFSNFDFFTVGLDSDDFGRGGALAAFRGDPFNCVGPYSNARPDECKEHLFAPRDELMFLGSFKVPSLRNVSRTAPYMHDGRIASLEGVVEHYSKAPVPEFPFHSDILPLRLTGIEKRALVAFLRSLDSDVVDPVSQR